MEVDLRQFSAILVDPPRAGVDDVTLSMMKTMPNILYVSCNTATLFPCLHKLRDTHAIRRVALLDLFPLTHYVETAVWLQRR